MQLKKCSKCGKTKELSSFYTGSRSWCKSCHRLAATERGRNKEKRRRRHLNRYKMMKGCAQCGYRKHPIALDFHHVGGKDKGIAGMLTHSLANLMKEIRKCIVLCSNCHRIEHSKEET